MIATRLLRDEFGRNQDIDVCRPEHWAYYYSPTLELIRSNRDAFEAMRHDGSLMSVPEADLKIGIHPEVLAVLEHGRWDDARRAAMSVARSGPAEQLLEDGRRWRYQRDGIAVISGPSWNRYFEEFA
jgi:hypothetical protein